MRPTAGHVHAASARHDCRLARARDGTACRDENSRESADSKSPSCRLAKFGKPIFLAHGTPAWQPCFSARGLARRPGTGLARAGLAHAAAGEGVRAAGASRVRLHSLRRRPQLPRSRARARGLAPPDEHDGRGGADGDGRGGGRRGSAAATRGGRLARAPLRTRPSPRAPRRARRRRAALALLLPQALRVQPDRIRDGAAAPPRRRRHAHAHPPPSRRWC
jgi:hypothetical protein